MRKWEQAFRVYAAIYTKANPHRASEIWQYVYCINTAAQSFHWDNVTFYDMTFRQLMAFKPWRTWAKTYLQGLNLATRDPILKKSLTTIIVTHKIPVGPVKILAQVQIVHGEMVVVGDTIRINVRMHHANLTTDVHIVVGGDMVTIIVGRD